MSGKGKELVDSFVGPAKGGGLKKAAATGGKKKKKTKKPQQQAPKPGKNARKRARKGKGGKSNAIGSSVVATGVLEGRGAIPAQYPSAAMEMGKAMLRRTSEGCVMRFVDMIGVVDTTASNTASGGPGNAMRATGGSVLACLGLNPESGSVLPTYVLDAETWERWRPLGFALHYRQGTPSTTSGMLHMGLLCSDSTTERDALINAAGTATVATINSLKGSRSGALTQDLSAHWEPEVWNMKEGGAPWYECGGSYTSLTDTVPAYFNVIVDNATAAMFTGHLYVELIVEFAEPRAPYTGAAGLGRMARAVRTKLTDEQKSHIRACFVKAVERLYRDIVVPLDRIEEVRDLGPGLSREELRGALIDMSKRVSQTPSVVRH